MNTFSDFFNKIADKLGLKIKRKLIQTAKVDDILPLTRIIANKVATLALLDSQINIIGETDRASFLDTLFKTHILTRINAGAEISLATGDCLMKPYTDGKNIGVDIIQNNDFVIVDSVGDFIKGVIIRAEALPTAKGIYTRVEVHRLVPNDKGSFSTVIDTLAYLDDKQVALGTVSDWANIPPRVEIQNVSRLLMGRIKSPTINYSNPNSPNGARITDGLDDIMKECVVAYNRFNKEFSDKETLIFADKTMFDYDDYGRLRLGSKSGIIQLLRGDDNKQLVDVFSPAIRADDLIKGLDVNLNLLETACGLSSGILTSPKTNNATATEILAGTRNTYAYVSSFRKNIQQGVEELIYAIDVLLNANMLAPLGEYTVTFDWSSAFVTHLTEEFNQLLQGESIGAISVAEIRSWLTEQDLQTAQEQVKEILKERKELDEEQISRY